MDCERDSNCVGRARVGPFECGSILVMTNREETKKQLARILKSLSSSDDRLERAITALEEAAGNNAEQEALERNPSKCN